MYPETLPDARAEDDDLLSLDVVDDPSEVREVPTLNAMAEHTEQELDLWPSVRPSHGMVVSKSNKLANLVGLIARK